MVIPRRRRSRSATAKGPATNNPWLRSSQGGWLLLQQICSQQLFEMIYNGLILLDYSKFPDPRNRGDYLSINPIR